jgi:peptidoglycan/LPS O-acetylase OafA/YrhL
MMANARTNLRIQELDGLRLFAATAVVLYHLTYIKSDTSGNFPEIDWLTRFGYLGVDLFFIISGFVILWSAQGRTPWQFAVSRFARLYPIFWVALALSSLIAGPSLIQLAANATMIAGYLGQEYIDGVYWTLQVELKFYVLVGALLILGQGKYFERWISGWLAASICAEFILFLRPIVIYPYSPLFIGGAMAFLIRSDGPSIWRLAIFFAAATLAILHADGASAGFIAQDAGIIPQLAVSVAFVAILLIAFGKLRLPCPASAAALTYPLYLIHNVIGRWLYGSIAAPKWISLIITLVAVYLMAYLLARLDQPLGAGVKKGADKLRLFTKQRLIKMNPSSD